MNKSSAITPFQLFSITLFSMLFGLNLYPSVVGHDIKSEWFIAQLISVALMFPVLFMLLTVFDITSTDDFTVAVRVLTGNVFSRIIGILLAVYFILNTLNLVLLEGSDIQLFLFDKTPPIVISITIAIVGATLCLPGIRSLAKLCELLAIPILLIIIIILAMYLSNLELGELKTLFQPNIGNIFSQVLKSVNCFSCVEMLLLFVCRVENRRSRKTALIGGFSVCAAIMLLLTLSVVGTFTLKAGADLVYPVTELARTVQFKYLRVIERFDAVMFFVSITYTCIFTAIGCYCTAKSLSMVFYPISFRYSVPVTFLLVILIFFGSSESFSNAVSHLLIYLDVAFLSLLIPVLFIVALIKRSGIRNET